MNQEKILDRILRLERKIKKLEKIISILLEDEDVAEYKGQIKSQAYDDTLWR